MKQDHCNLLRPRGDSPPVQPEISRIEPRLHADQQLQIDLQAEYRSRFAIDHEHQTDVRVDPPAT